MVKINEKTIKDKAKKAARKICVSGCPGNFENCKRCHESDGSKFKFAKVPRVSDYDECVLKRYNVPDQKMPKNLEERIKRHPSMMDCLMLCADCPHGTLNEKEFANGYYQIDRNEEDFIKFCMDCPVNMYFESMKEAEAEANMS